MGPDVFTGPADWGGPRSACRTRICTVRMQLRRKGLFPVGREGSGHQSGRSVKSGWAVCGCGVGCEPRCWRWPLASWLEAVCLSPGRPPRLLDLGARLSPAVPPPALNPASQQAHRLCLQRRAVLPPSRDPTSWWSRPFPLVPRDTAVTLHTSCSPDCPGRSPLAPGDHVN